MPTTFLKNPLLVSGTPAAATSGGGTQPPNTMTVEGTTGQATTGSAQTAGTGADISMTAGSGGAAPSGSTNGVGGSVTINPGAPGTGAGTTAKFGNVLLATDGGNVGVGTTSPNVMAGNKAARVLTVQGDGSVPVADGRIELSNPRSNASLAAGDTAGRVLFLVPNNSGTKAAAVVQTVLIGNGGPNGFGARLSFQIKHDNSPSVSERMSMEPTRTQVIGRLEVAPTSGAHAILRFDGDSTGAYFGTSTNHDCRLITNGAARVTINPAGSVGINTTAPTSTLTVKATASDWGNGLRLEPYNTNNAFQFENFGPRLAVGHNNSEVLSLTQSGSLGIGTTSPGSKLHVTGGVQVGTPTGGDKGAGSVNIAGNFYKNGTPLFAKLEKTISDLAKRLGRLETALSKKPGKATVGRKSAKPKKSTKSRKSAKGRR
jgi:hypothetical protein